ncbi:MAG: hypothetical protein K2V38_01015 [Gemmataceae bacterium]|nr:hypothetical protein [Gemmataceae bacterium]
MSTTFNFDELDDDTREYLTAVRDAEGDGAPGVFAPASDWLPGFGLIAGPIVIICTLVLTLTTWLDIVYNDPVGVALLQTAGFVVGGWLFFAKFRTGGRGNAGTWVYVDPQNVYEAFREQVTVTPLDDLTDANGAAKHDDNGNYQNTTVNILLGKRAALTFTLTNEVRAEHMVTFLNYLAWARGRDGGARGDLKPEEIGALAKYVVRTGDEPKDADGNLDLERARGQVNIDHVPEPAREGRSVPSVLPYAFIGLGAVACFVAMAFVVNPAVRDDAIYDLVTKEPFVEPRFLRAYLVDGRNTRHRDQVKQRLARFYESPVAHAERNARDKQLGEAMAAVLGDLSKADQPVVSLRVVETKSAPGTAGAKGSRETAVRTQFADGVNGAFAAEFWGQPITMPPGMVATEPLTPIGHQLIAFVEPPEGAPAVHFDFAYAVEAPLVLVCSPALGLRPMVLVTVNATIRPTLDAPGTSKQFFTLVEARADGPDPDGLARTLVRLTVGPTPAER